MTDLSTLVTEEQSKTESLMRSLSSLNDRCERNVTRSEYQSDLQAIENRLGHSLLTSQTTNANAIEVSSFFPNRRSHSSILIEIPASPQSLRREDHSISNSIPITGESLCGLSPERKS